MRSLEEEIAEALLEKARWKGRGIAARQTYLSDLVVPHPQFTAATSEIKRRAKRSIRLKKGAAFIVVAPTGAGKSKLAEYFEAAYPDRVLPEVTLRRVVYFTIPPRPTPKSMAQALLRALGDPLWDKKADADVKTEQIRKLLKSCRTRIVLIDNIHDIPERRTSKGVREVGNWLRDLVDKTSVLFAYLGAEAGLNVFRSNSQVRRRSPAYLRIDYFDIEEETGRQRLRRFLFELDRRLPLAEFSQLYGQDLSSRIWMATNGVMAYIMGLMLESLEIAVRAKRECLTMKDLEQGFRKLFEDATPAENPFSPGTVVRPLTKDGEPFEKWLDDGFE